MRAIIIALTLLTITSLLQRRCGGSKILAPRICLTPLWWNIGRMGSMSCMKPILFRNKKGHIDAILSRIYQFEHFNNSGEYVRLRTEKWLMHENNDTLVM